MKRARNLFIVTFIFCSVVAINAQSSKYYAGFKAGFGVPNLKSGATTTPLSENYESRLGFYGGILTEIQTTGWFGLRAEVNYSSQGGQRDNLQALPLPVEMEQLWGMLPNLGIPTDNYMYADIKSEAILNYLEIPVMAKINFGLGSRANFYVQAGPSMGILLSARNITTGNSDIYVDRYGAFSVDAILELAGYPVMGSQNFDNDQNIYSDVHRLNISGQGAIGLGFMMGSGKLFIEGGGNYGLVAIQKDEAHGTNKIGAGTIIFGYMFQL